MDLSPGDNSAIQREMRRRACPCVAGWRRRTPAHGTAEIHQV